MAEPANFSRRGFFLKQVAGAASPRARSSPRFAAAQAARPPARWSREADVVVIGSGAMGLPAAIVAREAGASVIVVEAQKDIGGHAITSGGNVPLGGGTSAQKKHGIEDSPDLLFRDLTDWSVVEPNGFPDYRYNDREIIRAFADNSAADLRMAGRARRWSSSTRRRTRWAATRSATRCRAKCTPPSWTGRWCRPASRPIPRCRRRTSSGNGLMRPLEAAARKAGVQILLEHKMVGALPRRRRMPAASSASRWKTTAPSSTIRARKAVIIATGGSTGNVNFRRMFDPRLTEEYCGLAGMPWSDQDASGEIAAMAVGASLWGLLQPDRRVRHQADQARHHRQPVWLRESADGCPAARSSTVPAPRACRCTTGRTSSW